MFYIFKLTRNNQVDYTVGDLKNFKFLYDNFIES